jgi:predicted acyltransferase
MNANNPELLTNLTRTEKNRDQSNPKLNARLISIDVLRGFAMFLILSIDIGGAPIFVTFTRLFGENFGNLASNQFSYGSDTGLKISYLAQPMFLFVVGLVMPFSLANRSRIKNNKIYYHIVKRSLILFLFGLMAGGNLLHLEFSNIPVYNNVLEYISISYLICAILILNTSKKAQLFITAGLLFIYWLLFLFVPVPGGNGDPFSSQMNLGIYMDNMLLGPFHSAGSCRVLATINFTANVLIGVLMGHIIFSNRGQNSKLKLLLIYGALMLLTGIMWGLFYPVKRILWTGSYVLITCGISTLLLAFLYQIIDLKGYSKWGFFFIVFGANSIVIYMMAHLFDFRLIGDVVVGGFSRLFQPNVHDFIQAVAAMAIMWLIMYWMYRKKTFIKI